MLASSFPDRSPPRPSSPAPLASSQTKMSALARSPSNLHMHSGAHYVSDAAHPHPPLTSASSSLAAPGGVSASMSTPHLSHLRQSNSINGLANHGSFMHHHAPDDHSHPHYPTAASSYDVYEEIGVGAFATVYHAAIHDTGEQVAIKVIDLDQFKSAAKERRGEAAGRVESEAQRIRERESCLAKSCTRSDQFLSVPFSSCALFFSAHLLSFCSLSARIGRRFVARF